MRALLLAMLLLPAVATNVSAEDACSDGIPPCTTGETKPQCDPWPDEYGRIVIKCGKADEPCGIAQQALCWTIRYTCFLVGEPVRMLTGGLLSCQGQPGQSPSEPLQMPQIG